MTMETRNGRKAQCQKCPDDCILFQLFSGRKSVSFSAGVDSPGPYGTAAAFGGASASLAPAVE